MSASSIRDTFFEECEDLIDALTEGLAEMIDGARDSETVNAVFRAVHSIKGGAGAFGLEKLVHFAHTFETVLDTVRSDSIEITFDLLKLLQRCGDHLADLVEAARDDGDVDQNTYETLLEALEEKLDGHEEEEFEFNAVGLDFDPDGAEDGDDEFKITFIPQMDLFANGHEPLLLIKALEDMGEVSVSLAKDDLPDLEEISAHEPYLGFEITLKTAEMEHTILEVFEFVEGLCTLEMTEAGGDDSSEMVPEVPLVPLSEPEPLPDPPPQAASVKVAPPKPQEKAPEEAKAETRSPKEPRATLRVDLERVDRLINTVGELIINQAVISQRIEELNLHNGSGLMTELEDYKLLAREIQEGVMAIRAQPVKPLFQRMSRIVREAADATDKLARMETVGEGTEVDKTVVERLADPLTHMIRNAVDHGLERPDVRESVGKDRIGTIRLSATHRSGSVLIEISDDGAGLNRERIKETALKKGLIPDDVELSPQEIDNLLFLPGFSTATEVSNLSGRGVGMDVVKTAISSLGGRVTISTKPGEGTTFSIVLPLTLAVMDGMVVRVAGQTMVVPIASIVETIRPENADLHRFGVGGTLLSVRGSYVPIVDVAKSLGHAPQCDDVAKQTLLLVQTEGQAQCALAVDGITDQRQVVVKSLEGNYGHIAGVSAATILGDGKIALIIDPDAVAATKAHGAPLNDFTQPKEVQNGAAV